MPHYPTICLIVAAGHSERMKGDTPKQYLPLCGAPMLYHTIRQFIDHSGVDAVQVVYNPKHQSLYDTAVKNLELPAPVAGGKTRQESVNLGLTHIAQYHPSKILIHDAARPLVSHRIITQVLDAIEAGKAVIPAVPVDDTLKKCSNNHVVHTVNRSDLMRAQTPQGFMYEDILNAHQQTHGQQFTDDAAISEQLDMPVAIVQGSQLNFKVTTIEDIHRAEKLMPHSTDIRTGSGFDVHAFTKPQKQSHNTIMLCGIEIPHDQSLKGHSDADVALHALVDALLGAISAGDIGQHFPPSDMRFKDADSSIFVEHAVSLLQKANGTINHVDLTLICEAPKLSPHYDAMRSKVAELLQLDKQRISIKSTTTEKLGFLGRGEGIAAQALATISLREPL